MVDEDIDLDCQLDPRSVRRLDFDLEELSSIQKLGHEGLSGTNNQIDGEPFVGMEFNSEESAYHFYNQYARKVGFSVRKNWLQRSKGVSITRTFCCSKEGRRREHKLESQVQYRRALTRTQCLAKMKIKLQMNGKYVVSKFIAEHNHEVVTPSKVHMLRSQRVLTCAQKVEADMADNSGITPKATLEFMGAQAGGRGNLGFMDVDYKNYFRRKRMKEMEKGDAGAILEYFQRMQLTSPSFIYAIQVDEDDQITNIFWADAKSIVDYSYFGDVVCFDTTYRVNSYGRPFAPFVGVNHHKQTIIFGAALLYDETTDSFKWLFETFLSAMSGKQPKTILTDQCAAMSNAIALVMPETYHRLCIWHIFQNAAKHLSHVFHGSRHFEYDFRKCVYDYEEEDEFLIAWKNMLENYELTENKWLRDLFKVRKKWALVYGRNTFCADMMSTQRSESLNHILKKYLKPKHDLLRFFTHYERVVADRRYEELRADFKMKQTTPVLFLDVKMLVEAAKEYTPEVFQLFQNEYKRSLGCIIHKLGEFETRSEFKVTFEGRNEGHVVRYDSINNIVMCSCKKFEFVGILCCHALKVLDYFNVKMLPSQYILTRWKRDAKVGTFNDHSGILLKGDPKDDLGKRYSYLLQKFVKLATSAAEDIEAFEFLDNISDKLNEKVIEIKKGVKAPSMTTSQSNPTANTDNEHVNTVCSQTVSGIKKKVLSSGSSRHMFQNPLDKAKKKKSRPEYVIPQENQRGSGLAPTTNILSPLCFPSPYSIVFPPSQFTQMGMDCMPTHGYQYPNGSMHQQNLGPHPSYMLQDPFMEEFIFSQSQGPRQ